MQAMRIGAQTAGVPQPPTALSPSAGPERETSFARGTFIQPPSARLVLVSEAGTLRPAWKLSLPASFHQWHTTLVDARTGAIVRDVNVAAAAGPVGNIFVDDPDDGPPVAAEFAGALPGARAVWSDGGLTAGNNAVAGADRDGDGTPVLTTIAEHPFSDAYETTAGADELADVDAAANNAFYWINVAHDRFYERGFTEAAGNFQADNFGAGGVGDDPVRTLVQFGGEQCDFSFPPCVNDARFITQEEGLPGFALFTLFEPPFRYIDAAFASDVVLHEYGHGVSNRLIGVSYVGGQHAFPLGEGWSDFFAVSITGDPVFAEYFNGDQERGLRTHAIDENPYTYADLCHIHPQGCVSHADGGIWAGTLWDVRDALIARYGTTAGIALAEELVVEGMMFTPRHPSFTDARDGVLEADIARGGHDHCTLWTIFAARGIGASALGVNIPPSSTPAFDLPAHCTGDTTSADGDGLPDAFEAQHECLDAQADDGTDDSDSDGLTSLREWTLGTLPCMTDTDGDSCLDGAELGPEPTHGGGRDPLDPWDFFDVTGDRGIDLADVMSLLERFGAGPGEAERYDRYAPDSARPWLTAPRHDGVDLHDALTLLASYGQACFL
jgi:hypothetical protein